MAAKAVASPNLATPAATASDLGVANPPVDQAIWLANHPFVACAIHAHCAIPWLATHRGNPGALATAPNRAEPAAAEAIVAGLVAVVASGPAAAIAAVAVMTLSCHAAVSLV